MKRAFFLIFLIYLFFALSGDFNALKRDFPVGEEATYIAAQFWREGSAKAIDKVRFFYPRGGRLSLTWRDGPQPYVPWLYTYLALPFFHFLKERGFYILNAFLLLGSLLLLFSIFGSNAYAYLLILATSLPAFFLMEGPHLFVFFLGVLLYYFFRKEKHIIVGLLSGILSFFSPIFFFFFPFILIKGKKKILSLSLGFFTFFALVFIGLYLPGSLPWDIPYLTTLYKGASSFITSPVVFYSGSFPVLEFFFGRFTGALLYFPVFLLLLWGGVRFIIFAAFSTFLFLVINPVHSPFGFFGNPWLVGLVPLVMPFSYKFWQRVIIVVSIISLALINLFPFRSGTYPLIFSQQIPFKWGKVETNIINSIPALRIDGNYHLDRNFFFYAGNTLRPRGTEKVEFLKLSQSSKILFKIKDLAGNNRAFFKVNHTLRNLNLKRKKRYMEVFQGKEYLPGLFLYHIQIKGERCRPVLPQKICLSLELSWK